METGWIQSLVCARDLAVYVRNAGTFATAVITGGDGQTRVDLAVEILEIAGQADFVFEDQTGALRASMRAIGGFTSSFTGMRMGGVSAPYGGYLEAMRPVLDVSSRIAMNRILG